MSTKTKFIILSLIPLSLGILIGGYVFRDTQPRSFLAIDECNSTCLNPNELLGLLASAGIQNTNGLIPSVVKETDKTIIIKHPFPQAPIHYLVLPKKDIKDIGSLTEEDTEYMTDMIMTLSAIIREEQLTNYKVVTNGPDVQLMRYMHFHLIGRSNSGLPIKK